LEKTRGNSKYGQLQILNLAGFFLMVIVNFLANYLPINNLDTGFISDLYPNLFTPAGFTFSIWGLIYLLLVIFVFYQARGIFSKEKPLNLFVEKIDYWFFVSCLLNTAWIFAWHYLQIGLSLVIMVLLLGNLLLIYNKINSIPDKREKEGYLFIFPAFSIYTGWITIATVANVTAFLVARDWGRFGLSEVFWMVIILLIATAIVLAFMYKNKDWLYSLVAIWAFFGIVVERLSAEVTSAIVVFVVILCMIIIGGGIFLVLKEKIGEGKVI